MFVKRDDNIHDLEKFQHPDLSGLKVGHSGKLKTKWEG
jgi:hypothetical protein